MFSVGEVVGVVRLKNAYDSYVFKVIGDRLDKQDAERTEAKGDSGKSKRKPATYKVTKPMPSLAEYKELKTKRFTTTADALMDEAYSEIESLAEEMRSWYDALTETLQNNDRGTRVNDAADALENIQRQDAPESMSSIEVYYLPSLDTDSRAKRSSAAQDMLSNVAGALHDYVSENKPEEKKDDEEESEDKEEVEEIDWDELETIADQCETDVGELENVEFPGMYD